MDKQLVRSGSNRTLGVSVSGKSAAQYIVAIANGSPVQQRYTVNAMSDTAGVAKMDAAAPDHVDSVRRHFLTPLGDDGVQQLSALFTLIRAHLHNLQSA